MQLIEWTKRLGMDDRFQERYLNEGFSGGEKKRNEILQMAMLEPDVAVLDETDSGLDIDALRAGRGRHRRGPQATRPELGILAHHALPAHPRPPRPRRRARAARRPHRRDRRPRARPRSRGARASTRSASEVGEPMTALDVAAHQARLPDPRARGATASASSTSTPRRRRRSRSRCSTRWTTATAHYYANIHRGVYTIAEEATAAFEARARARSPRFVNAPRRRRDRVHAQRDRGDQPRRVHVGARQPARRRRRSCSSHMEHHANVVPWHMLAAERGVELRWIPLTADFRLDLTEPRPAARRRQAARDHRDVERARHDQRHPPARRRRARRTARSCSSTRASTCRTSRPTCRPGTPTSSRSPRTRCAARAASARSGPATSCSRRCRRSSAAAR